MNRWHDDWTRSLTRAVGLLVGIYVPALSQSKPSSETSFALGDVFVAVGNSQVSSQVQWRGPKGSLNKVLETGTGNHESAGMAFN